MALRLPSFRRRPESTHPRHRSITGAIQALLLAGMAILAAAACGDIGARPNNEGNEAYEQKDYETALSSYEEAIEKSPELPEPHYNSGNVQYRQGRHEEAQESYDRALLDADEDLYRDILFNQGNTQLQAGEIDEAIESYKEVLRLDPNEDAAKHNLEVALGRPGRSATRRPVARYAAGRPAATGGRSAAGRATATGRRPAGRQPAATGW